ncbi:YbfB/YjiJ family MFS transporter [Oscillochloris sp. ZM17-4]|uniref:YbfB/YjiJ family MFS transporter n=1 Tax=Oscillochloris sp. ZM17-4 TaxID=2866714 RepID=UPI001C73C121|nr:YbfB/YjiJ family MFS transporter [Oscillochloris sp. ZM17-4]MBX0329577.1 YbfB/YjiJ family MFS transporter [Oscillochloris sp. ZM17-4]
MDQHLPSEITERRQVVAAALLSLGGASALGFGRFAYALLLEPMRSSLGWSYAQSGLINSANAVGYLLGTLVVGLAVSRLGAARTVRLGTLLAGLSLIATGLLTPFPLLLLMRLLNGFGGGLVFVGGATVVLQYSQRSGAAPPLGLYYSGPGLGIAISGGVVPLLLGPALGWSWQAVWVTLGLAGLAAMALMEPHLRAAPAAALGARGRRTLAPAADYLRIWPMMLAFGIYGLGYIGYMTFVIAYLQSIHAAAALVQWFWCGLGLCAAAGGSLWAPLINRLGPRPGMALIMAALATAALLPVLAPHPASFILSAALFGGSFLSAVTAMTSEVRLRLPAEHWAAVTGHAVAIFAAGQLLGPTVTGLVADLPGGLALGMLLSGGALGLAALVVLPGMRRV